MQRDLAYVSGSIITFVLLFIIAYHVYTEILIKNKFCIYFKTLTIRQKAKIQGVATIQRALASDSVEPSSYTTTMMEAPQDELRSNRASNADEVNLREPLLESVDGTTSH